MKSSVFIEPTIRRISMACFALAGGVACLILLAWRLGWSGAGIFDLTASLTVLLLGLSVAAWLCQRRSGFTAVNWVGLVVAFGTVLISGSIVYRNLIELPSSLELWLAETLAVPGVTPRIHMNVESAFGCLLTGIACLFGFRSCAEGRKRPQLVAISALIVLILGLVILLCYFLQSPFFEHTTLLTGVEFSLLGLGLLLTAGSEVWPLSGLFLSPLETLSRRKLVWSTINLILLLGITVVATRSYYFRSQKSLVIRAAQRGLATVADLKATQLEDWRKERLADADYLYHTPYITRRALEVLSHPQLTKNEEMLRDWMTAFFAKKPYEQMVLLDEHLNVRTAHPNEDTGLTEPERRATELALKSNEVTTADLHRETNDAAVQLTLAVPLVVRGEGRSETVPPVGSALLPTDRSKGALLVRINADKALGPMLRTWPTSSTTSETMLVRQEGNKVVCLNELRNQTNTALMLRLPLSRQYVESRAVLGIVNSNITVRGATKGLDYRKVPVLALIRQIPESPWTLVVKMDEEEVLSPVRRQGWLVASVAGVLVGAVILGINLLGRQRHLDSVRRELVLERRQRESETRFRTLFESSRDAIMLLDRTEYLDCNPAALKLFGFASKEQFLAKRPGELSPPCQPDDRESRAIVQADIEAAYEHGSRFFEWQFQRQDGSVFPGEMKLSRVELGEKSVLQAMVRDITMRKQAEEALLKEQSLMRVLMDHVPDAIYFKDLEGRFTRINWALARRLGLNDPTEAIGKTDFDFFTEEHAQPAREDELAISRSGEPLVGKEEKETWLNGQTAWVSTTKMPLRDGKGAIIGTFGISRDITAHKLAEEDRLIVGKLESTGVLAGGIAHDFNNLLTIILMNLGMAESSSKENLSHHLKAAQHATLTARNLTQQFITFAEKDAAFRQPSDLTGLIEETVSAALNGSDVRSELLIAAGLHLAEMDAGQIRQVIRNLVVNAREAMSDGGVVSIRAENVPVKSEDGLKVPPGEYVRVSVRDQGHGISSEVLPKIFDPYFSTKQRGSQKGMGLGLTICHSVVQKHGGVITVDTKVGKGTTFAFYLPACPPPANRDQNFKAILANTRPMHSPGVN